jgi:lysophospholipase L1-like esterase
LVKDVGRRARTGRGSEGWVVHHFAKDPPFPSHVRFGFTGSVYEASAAHDESRFDLDGARSARLFWLDTGKGIRVDVDGKTWLTVPASAEATHEAKDVEVRLPPLSKELIVVAERGARVFGVALEHDRRGVVVDTIGVPAASTKLYTEATDHDVFVAQLRARAPTLLVAMLGGNETRALSWGALDEATFGARLGALIDTFQEAAPHAACLVVTPIDAAKTTTANATLVTRDEIRAIVAVQRAVAAQKGCGFFDLFAAMGAAGSLQRMREQKLVSDDLVHPTAKGGDVLGQLFADAILLAYRTSKPASEELAHRRRTSNDDDRGRFVGLSFPVVADQPITVGAHVSRPRPRALSRFFARLSALGRGETTRVAIGQFGASHTAGQSLTDRMRARLAARYGGAGPGFVAVGTASKRQVPAGVVRDIVGAFDLTDGRDVVAGGALGMAGMKARLLPGGRLSVGFCAACNARSIQETPGSIQLAWLYTPDMGTADVFIDGERTATVSPSSRRTDSDVQFLRVSTKGERARIEVVSRDTPEPSSQASDGLSPVGPIHILGVVEELERPGVILDAVGLPGTTGMTPQRWRQDVYAEEVKSRRYDLIVTAWGTNEAGIASLDATTYKHHFGNTLATLQSAAPDADCLIIGASDRFDLRPGGLVPAPNHDLVERVQKELAAERGCAFFSMRDAMGGPGSMKQWVRDGLALPDHTHFTREGYRKLADAIIDDLLRAAAADALERGAPGQPAGASRDGTADDDLVDDDIVPVPPTRSSSTPPEAPVTVVGKKTAALAPATMEGAARALP